MTSNHDQDAFEFRFEGAVNAAHLRRERGDAPSPRAWKTIHAGLPESMTRAETADPRAIGPDLEVDHATTERKRRMDATLAPLSGGYARQQPRRIGWMALLAAGLVGIMIITSVWLNGGGVPPDTGSNLAWAPGTGTPDSSLELASPAASPPVYTYGPEYACDVEPLTADQVFDIVMNPAREFERRRGEDHSPTTERLEEGNGTWFRHYEQGALSREQYVPLEENALHAEIEDAANTFWNCMMTGTTFQMWSLMTPYAVQHEILLQYPVLRDEETLRQHIEEWGPRRYSANLYVAFLDLGNVDPILATRIVADGWDSIMVTTDRQTDEVTSAIVVMWPHPDSGLDGLDSVEIFMMPTPDGQWWVGSINFPFHTGRG